MRFAKTMVLGAWLAGLGAPVAAAAQTTAAATAATPVPPALQKKAAQQTVAVDQLPAPLVAAIQKAYPQSTIVSAAKVTRGGQERFELSVQPAGNAKPVAVLASADGQIRTALKTAATATPPVKGQGQRKAQPASALPPRPMIEVGDLPKAVVKAVKDAYPKDTILSAVRISEGPPAVFELSLNDVATLMPLRVVLTADGVFQKR